MNKRVLSVVLCFIIVIASDAVSDHSNKVKSGRARDLIRRNIFNGSEEFPIADHHVHQYGSLHLDGPSGGMLYRFRSNADALTWIIGQMQLQKKTINPGGDLPIDFLDKTPKWWNPWEQEPMVFYSASEDITAGGKRTVILIYNRQEDAIYIADHYTEMRGV